MIAPVLKEELTNTRPLDLGSQHVGGNLKSDITGEKDSDGCTVLLGCQVQVFGDSSNLG